MNGRITRPTVNSVSTFRGEDQKLQGEWIGSASCQGDVTLKADGTYSWIHYGPGDATYQVEVAFASSELVAVVRDTGSWRDRRGEHRGRGLNIMEELMDRVEVAAEAQGTVVTMRRRLAAARAA